jgi:2-C-methyl-D-erythritol 4-phosphate cytidylyltransferase
VATWAIVVAGGRGTRFGRLKQYADLCGRPVFEWALRGAREACEGVVLVVPPEDVGVVCAPLADIVVAGGDTRSASVRAGLAAVPAGVEVIAVHDAARPLAAPALWASVLHAVREGADAAIPGIAVADTVKRVAAGAVVGTLDRTELVLVQTPQAFRATVLRTAHATGADTSDDAALVEARGGRVVVVPGDAANLKVTEPFDIHVAALLAAQWGAPA